ncbi:hypothetical protein M422DRAFT_264179 [Sphaerobolus stellatus SS14]|uniref:Cytochrome P450 n=1 Tax=Sphaerobolus stellatus (strain SS14) TaxID=990650 RepID=A0A0C9UWR9_SPHS4|nr:hypothetical protein M422DRAFT_264179 [Sphaerobolus stellatus SS14]
MLGDADFSWMRNYGTALYMRGPFGRLFLFTVDPRVIQRLLSAFEKGHLAVAKWRDIIAQNGGIPVVLNVHSWLARITLDAIGAGNYQMSMDYDLGSLQGNENELAKVYENLFAHAHYNWGDADIVFLDVVGYLPEWIIDLLRNSPDKRSKQMSLLAAGKEGGKDIMSLLVSAKHWSATISTEDLVAQLTTLLLAGHETMASTMNWLFYELSRHPDIQIKLRKEIIARIRREVLRYHPIQARTTRTAGQGDIILLSEAQKTTDGKTITEVAVEKEQRTIVSFDAYNRLTSIWGEDAHVWNPERFLNDNGTKTKTGLGVLSNLLTFSSGERSCIGWRFVILEMQSTLCALIPNFKFSSPPGNVVIFRVASGLMLPMDVFL